MKYEDIEKAGEIIKNGGIVIFPTETVYGIGANALDENAVRRIYEVKERDFNKPISVLVSNFDMIEEIARDITNIEYKLMRTFFPGPFTIILKKKDTIPNIVTSGQDTIGVRMPDSEIARKLIEYVGKPLATPSANISGKPSGVDPNEIKKDFDGKVNYFIDNGKSKLGISSTIVKVENDVPKILREGSISKEEIYKALKGK